MDRNHIQGAGTLGHPEKYNFGADQAKQVNKAEAQPPANPYLSAFVSGIIVATRNASHVVTDIRNTNKLMTCLTEDAKRELAKEVYNTVVELRSLADQLLSESVKLTRTL